MRWNTFIPTALLALTSFSGWAQIYNVSELKSLIESHIKNDSAIKGNVELAYGIYQYGVESNDDQPRAILERRFTSDRPLHLASVSKHFTAAAMAYFEQQGLITLDTFVADVIADWPNYASKIQLKHLLSHSSGLPAYESQCNTHLNYNASDVLEFINNQKQLNFQPGSRYRYSNTGYVVLAKMVERLSHQSFPQFMREHFFIPLNMLETHIKEEDSPREFYPMQTYLQPHGLNLPNPGFGCDFIFGDGGIFTTLEDLAKWGELYTGNRFWTTEQLNEITRPIPYNSEVKTRNYGHGIKSKQVNHLKVYYHGGSWMGAKTEAIYLPKQHIAIFILSNGDKVNVKSLGNKIIKFMAR